MGFFVDAQLSMLREHPALCAATLIAASRSPNWLITRHKCSERRRDCARLVTYGGRVKQMRYRNGTATKEMNWKWVISTEYQ
jgi:hypothetical protein